jgi:hypothetical protein
MKELSQYKLNKIENNLRLIYSMSDQYDIINGKQWYRTANEICNTLAKLYDTDTFTVSGIISALSPRNKWHQNIIDAETVLKAVKEGKNPDDVKVCTFHTNKRKAFKIAKKELIITNESRKTFAFCQNISLLNENFVTVDIWHLRACFYKTIKIGSASIGKIAYSQIENITKKIASEFNLSGFEFQAIIWNIVRDGKIDLK